MEEKVCYGRDPEELLTILKERYQDKVVFNRSAPRRLSIRADRSIILDLCGYLQGSMDFEHASSLCGVDWGTHMQVVYHISNYRSGMLLEILVDVPNDDPRVDSVARIWEGADWHERETWELFGIVFEGHPNLKRLLTPDFYEFFPFRKSYKLRGQD